MQNNFIIITGQRLHMDNDYNLYAQIRKNLKDAGVKTEIKYVEHPENMKDNVMLLRHLEELNGTHTGKTFIIITNSKFLVSLINQWYIGETCSKELSCVYLLYDNIYKKINFDSPYVEYVVNLLDGGNDFEYLTERIDKDIEKI